MADKTRDPVSGLSDAELAGILADETGSLKARLESMETSAIHQGVPNLHSSSETIPEQAYRPGVISMAANGLAGWYLKCERKGNHPSSNESFRFDAEWGGVNFGYSSGRGHDVRGFFACATFDRAVSVRRPIWVGIGKVTYHDRVELWADPNLWSPGGTIWWGEVWGWFGIGFSESELARWHLRLSIKCT
jgi:hypothetical protein